MIRTLFIVLLLFVILGNAQKPFINFLNIEKTEILFFTKTEETVVIKSTYEDKRPNSSYLLVQLEDPKVLQVVNVTKIASDVTNFILDFVTDEEGETNLTIQLWDFEGLLRRSNDFSRRENFHFYFNQPASPGKFIENLHQSFQLVSCPMEFLDLPIFTAICCSRCGIILEQINTSPGACPQLWPLGEFLRSAD
nr:sodium/bile acid cotransporter 5 isoform X2 [Dasypus novemcinctus]